MGLIERQTAIEAIAYSIELCNKALDSMTLGGRDRYAVEVERHSLLKLKDDFKLLPSAQLEKRYTKADYIMALHKEYGCDLETAEKAHDVALEYLRSLSKMKG